MRLALVLLLCTLVLSACERKEPAKEEAPRPADTPALASSSGLALPSAFRGTLPCADCSGIDTRLLLRSDHSYLLDERYMSTDLAPAHRFTTLGRWEENKGQIHLSDSRTGSRYFRIVDPHQIKMQDSHGQEISSQMNYTLRRSDIAFLPTGRMTLRGHYSYMADAGFFTECETGLRWPVAQAGDNATLETRYGSTRLEAGAPVYAELEAHLGRQPRMEGDGSEEAVFVTRVVRVEPQRACPPPAP